LTPNDAPSLLNGWGGSPMSHVVPRDGETRFLLAHAGIIDPQSIDSALAHGVWSGLARAIQQQPVDVITEIEAAILRGRGGAGFPTARKWRTAAQAPPGPRYVVCNADESEPLAFKDRVLLETNPHAILEGLAIAGYAVGAERGFVYIRGEYEPQATLLARAIEQSRERGWLGERIAGTEFHFDVELHRGGGAYICGEESALLESLEGRRGEPRARPPYPAVAGYQGRPTVVNNVETLFAAAILQRGAAAYRDHGSQDHPGTRLYAILGHVQQPGLIEAPLNLSVRQLIERFAGGLLPGSTLGCALVGGAAGVLINEQQLDIPLGLQGEPSTIPAGTGAVLVCDHSVSPVRVLRELLHFFEHESCGKCTPCRIGTSEARRTLDVILSGDAVADDLLRLQQLATTLHTASLCGLGVSVAEPIRSALAHFDAEFQQLVRR
jgi:NADH:ubiquinone oxidoreductase subunit F (NADH-binding)